MSITMVRTRLLFIVFLIIASVSIFSCDSAEILTWDKSYSIEGFSGAADLVIETGDGGYLTAGGASWDDTLALLKVDASGNAQWSRTYEKKGSYWSMRGGYSIKEISGGFLVSYISPDDSGVYMVRLDTGGAETGSLFVSTPSLGAIFALSLTAENGLVVAGEYGGNFVIVKLDAGGALVWGTTCAATENRSIGFIRQAGDGGVIAVGEEENLAEEDQPCWLFKLDANGKLLWTKYIRYLSRVSYNTALSFENLSNGGFVMSATNGTFEGPSGSYVVKLSKNGTVVWQQLFLGEFLYRARQTKDKGYILTGVDAQFNSEVFGFRAMKLNSRFITLWSTFIEADDESYSKAGHDIIETSDGGYCVAGANDLPEAAGNYWIMKLNGAGKLE